jgi:hypothetical protein
VDDSFAPELAMAVLTMFEIIMTIFSLYRAISAANDRKET